MVGEWTNYAKKNAECWPNASTDVPAFLDYLTGLGVCGLVVWSLRPGVVVVDHTTWQPTQILASYKCDGSVSGQGAGQLIQDQFQQWAQPGPGTAAAGQGAASR